MSTGVLECVCPRTAGLLDGRHQKLKDPDLSISRSRKRTIRPRQDPPPSDEKAFPQGGTVRFRWRESCSGITKAAPGKHSGAQTSVPYRGNESSQLGPGDWHGREYLSRDLSQDIRAGQPSSGRVAALIKGANTEEQQAYTGM